MSRKLLPPLLLAAGVVLASATPQAADLPEERTLYIAPGQSLPSLVRTLYPDHPGYWDTITDWIVRENAHAFVDADPERMGHELRVRIPGRAQLERVAAESVDAADAAAPSARAEADSGQAAREPALVFGERFLFINPAQSLADLVPRIYAGHDDLWGRIVQAIMERNRQRLAGLDEDATVARGTRLQIPEVVPVEPERDRAEVVAVDEPPPLTEPSIGVFGQVDGDVEVESRYSRLRAGRTDHPVHRGDVVRTGADARAVIELDDGERLYVRADSRVRLRDWELPETGAGTRVIELLQGGMRAVTGAIGNRTGDAYRTITPNATMGVRGTDYSLRLCGAEECGADGEAVAAGLYAGVHAGGIHLLNVAGELNLEAGEFAHVVDEGQAPVRVDGADMDFLLAVAGDDESPMPQVSAADAEADDEGSAWGWLWAVGALVLLGVAL